MTSPAMREVASEQARRDNWWEQFVGDDAFLRDFDPDLRAALDEAPIAESAPPKRALRGEPTKQTSLFPPAT